MNDKPSIDKRSQVVQGSQTNIAVEAHSQVLSGQFLGHIVQIAAAKPSLPLQKPLRVQHFTGREEELASLLQVLQPGRVFTICGPGGMGKTALAAEAIWQLAPGNEPPERFPDGIIFHTFYHMPQAALALEAIARAYGEDPRQSPLEAARRSLAGRQALIVLDGTEACEDLETVLSVTASCGVLITTRRHSDAPAEFSDLPPLPLDKAVQLLQEWAGELASDKSINQKICSLLGCLPLAIFLVGRYIAHRRLIASDYLSWLEKTPLEALQIGERQYLNIPLLMEHDLVQVSDRARACLGVAGVLAQKPFEPEVIATTLEISLEEVHISLGDLVNFGLLTRPDVRYQVTHSLVHAYARSRLAPAGSSLARLAEFYNNFIRKQTGLGLAGYALLDAQRDHILAVQSACNKARLWGAVRTLTWAIEDYLGMQGHWTERVAIVQVGLDAARSEKVPADEASFLNLLGIAYADLGDAQKAIEYSEQSLAIARDIGDRRSEGNALGNLGLAYNALGDAQKAIEHYEQALTIAREIGNRRSEGKALGNLGLAYRDLGDAQKAIEHYEQALTIARDIRDRRGEGNRLGNLGSTYYLMGETSKALQCYNQLMEIAHEIGYRYGEGNSLWGQAICYEKMDNLDQAIDKAEKALKIFEQIESPSASNMRELLTEWRNK